MHGFNGTSVKKMYKNYDNVIYGHQHKILTEEYAGNYWEHRAARCIGCLTKLTAKYCGNGASKTDQGWEHGFALVNLYSNNVCDVKVIRIQRDMVVGNERGDEFYAVKLASLDSSLSVLD